MPPNQHFHCFTNQQPETGASEVLVNFVSGVTMTGNPVSSGGPVLIYKCCWFVRVKAAREFLPFLLITQTQVVVLCVDVPVILDIQLNLLRK